MSRKWIIGDHHHYGCKPVARSKDSPLEDVISSRGGGEEMRQRIANVPYDIQINT